MIKILSITGLDNAKSSMGICTDTKITDSDKLLNLIGKTHNTYHKSIFEHIVVHYEVEASIKLLSQINRHKHIAISQQSTRYALRKMSLRFEKSGDARLDDPVREHLRSVNKLIDAEASCGFLNETISSMLPMCIISKARYTQTLHDFCMLIIRRNDNRAMFEARDFAKIAKIKLRDYHRLSNTYTDIYYRIFEKIEALYVPKKED
jgi:hypothetical protein